MDPIRTTGQTDKMDTGPSMAFFPPCPWAGAPGARPCGGSPAPYMVSFTTQAVEPPPPPQAQRPGRGKAPPLGLGCRQSTIGPGRAPREDWHGSCMAGHGTDLACRGGRARPVVRAGAVQPRVRGTGVPRRRDGPGSGQAAVAGYRVVMVVQKRQYARCGKSVALANLCSLG